MNRDDRTKNVNAASPEPNAQAVWRHASALDDAVGRLSVVVDGVDKVYGRGLSAVLSLHQDYISSALAEIRWAYRGALEDHDDALERLRADKDHHIEHLVATRSQRTIALARVAEQLGVAVEHVKERARKGGRPEPEWCERIGACRTRPSLRTPVPSRDRSRPAASPATPRPGLTSSPTSARRATASPSPWATTKSAGRKQERHCWEQGARTKGKRL